MAEVRQIAMLTHGSGAAYWVGADHVTIKASGEQTEGAYALLEVVVPPNAGPPPHIHHREDEAFSILEGDFEFLAGDETVRATAGDFIHAPKGIAHTYTNVGSVPGRMIVVASPPGFERFVAEVGVPVAESPTPPTAPPDVAKFVRIAGSYGIEILLPLQQ